MVTALVVLVLVSLAGLIPLTFAAGIASVLRRL